jgi:hypothetical protein
LKRFKIVLEGAKIRRSVVDYVTEIIQTLGQMGEPAKNPWAGFEIENPRRVTRGRFLQAKSRPKPAFGEVY